MDEPQLSNFDKALAFVLRWEGGYSNDPHDPGGETKFGISKRSYPDVNIKDLTRESAAAIYRRDYWDVMHCDTRGPSMGLAVFDSAVNCGIARTTLWLEDSSNLDDFIKHRVAHYERLATKRPLMAKYLKGWMNRVKALEKEIQDGTI
jgi:hypothetical protein